MSVTEQRYQAVLDAIGEGRAVMEAAVLGGQWAGEDGGRGNPGRDSQEARRWNRTDEGQGVRHFNRSTFATDQPKVFTP